MSSRTVPVALAEQFASSIIAFSQIFYKFSHIIYIYTKMLTLAKSRKIVQKIKRLIKFLTLTCVPDEVLTASRWSCFSHPIIACETGIQNSRMFEVIFFKNYLVLCWSIFKNLLRKGQIFSYFVSGFKFAFFVKIFQKWDTRGTCTVLITIK